MENVIHKKSTKYAEMYAGFGRYQKAYAPLCVGPKMLWRGCSYYLARNWKDVTCKHCLKKWKI